MVGDRDLLELLLNDSDDGSGEGLPGVVFLPRLMSSNSLAALMGDNRDEFTMSDPFGFDNDMELALPLAFSASNLAD